MTLSACVFLRGSPYFNGIPRNKLLFLPRLIPVQNGRSQNQPKKKALSNNKSRSNRPGKAVLERIRHDKNDRHRNYSYAK